MSRPALALPIRARLTLWYTAVLAVVLAGMAALTYSAIGSIAARQAEQTLRETVATVMVSLRVLGSAAPPALRAQMVAVAADRFRYNDRRILMYDDGQLVVASSVPPEDSAEVPFVVSPMSPALLAAIRSGQSMVLLPPPRDDAPAVRAFIRRPRFGHGRFAIVVLGSTRAEDDLLADLRRYFFIFIPAALVLAALVGYFLAAKSLAPVAAMTRQAERIGASNLDERLPVANPRDDLGRLAGVLNSLLSRLHDAFEQQRRFMADAAHELRTPVAVIRGEAEVSLARRERDSAEYRDALDVVAGESARLSGIVDDLFTLARADAGEVPVRPHPMYLDEVVTETTRAVGTLASRRRIQLTVDAPEEMPYTGDEALLRRMLTNLLDNAVKYTPPGGRIRVTAGREGDRYRIAVSDTGPGIPPGDRERIFQRFHRLDQARPGEADGPQGGAGLGLPIARWIAEAHGGTLVLAESTPAGSTFVAELPVRGPKAESPVKEPAAERLAS
ncbi:MAG TPA: ATP-binding protein [Longimicrobiales bacterium]